LSEPKSHWEKVYRSKQPSDVSWYQPHLRLSFELIERAGVGREDSIIDVGGGASTLVDDLLNRGYRNITVLDVSSQAIDISKRRLGNIGTQVEWIAHDVTDAILPNGRYRLWHDRAVFHFLTNSEDRQAYIRQIHHALRPDGFVVISTFSLEGPHKCSGLEVCRYSAETLLAEFGDKFRLVDSRSESHLTPSHATQAFTYCLFSLDEHHN
jgi:2-polyprenyl-3-methyl-5-hydroxy-6-metoxy-1,4-benzoquinol methylase